MDLRADAPVFVPSATETVLGDLLIQKLATEIEHAVPAETNRAPESSSKHAPKHCTPAKAKDPAPMVVSPLKNIGDLPASGIFCPWCQMRAECAFHVSRSSQEQASSKSGKCEASGLLLESRQHTSAPPQSGTSQLKPPAPAAAVPRIIQQKPRASEWLDSAAASKKALDDEDASTDGGSSSLLCAESDGSDVPSTSLSSHGHSKTNDPISKGYIILPSPFSGASQHSPVKHGHDSRTHAGKVQLV
jgi:hypothetical protein